VDAADEACPLEGNTSAETYLRADALLEVARRHGADAVHPGYGFLSENPDFAQACRNTGLMFIGPTPQAMKAVGDKTNAKRTAAEVGVPVVPGWWADPNASASQFADAAGKIGYPVLIKAAAGGGGKGMRLVHDEREIGEAVEAARREAGSAFGDARVFLEKYIRKPRHVEFQVFGDAKGNVVHLFERECSIQRRHQKIIEESPSPALSPELRVRMGDAAVRMAKAVGYTNAGTVEFIVDENDSFYFLEVNARLQVEHPVTEMVIRRDLVALQLHVALGRPLPFSQSEVRQEGHALECRLYAEDAERGFLPSIGVLTHFDPPLAPNVRVDSGVRAGSEVSVYYDPMLAKMIVWGESREESIRRMSWALGRFAVLGVTTNIGFLRSLIKHPDFLKGRLHTQFLEEHRIVAHADDSLADRAALIAAVVAELPTGRPTRDGRSGGLGVELTTNPWRQAGRWRTCST
jgi:acetyl/propionyl-CoA carboxylase alpha subunit